MCNTLTFGMEHDEMQIYQSKGNMQLRMCRQFVYPISHRLRDNNVLTSQCTRLGSLTLKMVNGVDDFDTNYFINV